MKRFLIEQIKYDLEKFSFSLLPWDLVEVAGVRRGEVVVVVVKVGQTVLQTFLQISAGSGPIASDSFGIS